jgi:addiction module HigA family antidote
MISGGYYSNGKKEMQAMSELSTITETRLPNIHPGEILQKDFLEPMDISAYRLSQETGIPQTRISEIIHGRRRITADTALRLKSFFGTSAEFWLGLQDDYDLEEESARLIDVLPKITRFVFEYQESKK